MSSALTEQAAPTNDFIAVVDGWLAYQKKELREIANLWNSVRKSVVNELQFAQQKKEQIALKSVRLEQQLNDASLHLRQFTSGTDTLHGFEPVPEPSIIYGEKQAELPIQSGVYFAWRNGAVEYVGQSINISARCRPPHHKLLTGDLLSYVLVCEEQLNFAEAFYIGILKPARNFGARGGRAPGRRLRDRCLTALQQEGAQ